MGFMDQVKAAAKDLQGTVETQLAGTQASRDVEKAYRDLGMLAYLKATERPIQDEDWERLMGTLRAAEADGTIRTFNLTLSTPPPAPGMAGQTPPVPPAPGSASAGGPATGYGYSAPPASGGTPPPPPPPPAG